MNRRPSTIEKKKGWSTVPLVTNALPAPLAPSWIIVISRLLFLFFLPRARGVRSSRLFDPSKVGSGGSLVIVMSSYGGAQVAVDLSNSSCASYLRCPGLTPTAARVLRSAASPAGCGGGGSGEARETVPPPAWFSRTATSRSGRDEG